jgi:toxin ParE1/3/4
MVVWTTPAKNDLKAVFDYIEKDSRFYAEKVIEVIVQKSEMLVEFSKKGRIVPEIEQENIREVLVYSYRMMYEIKKDDIYILNIIHTARDYNNINK